jgi:selenocysteine lyase/cysteine desulfurase
MLSCQNSKFSLDPSSTYLNCAYIGPLLKKSEKAGLRGIRLKRTPSEITPEMFFDDASKVRAEFARLINLNDPSRIAIIPSVSYGMAVVTKNLQINSGQEIIVAAEQFPSNVYPWQSLCSETGAVLRVISAPDQLTERGKEWNERLLSAITPATKVVALAHVHWADGTKFDLEAIRKRTREVGALLIIDGTQSVGALPFDVARIDPDALICAGYKWLLGPYGVGLAYFGKFFDGGRPVEENWINRLNSENFTQLINYQHEYHTGSLRYEVGEHSNFVLLPMILKALEQINRWGIQSIQEYCDSITSAAIDELRSNDYWIEQKEFRSCHLFGVRLPVNTDPAKIKSHLEKNKIYVSFRGNAIRVSPNVYNRESDLKKFVTTLLK